MYNNIIRQDGVRVDHDAVQLELHSGWTTVASRRGCLAQSHSQSVRDSTMNKTPSTVTVPGKNGIGYTWEYATEPDDRSTCEKFKTYIWDPDTHQFLGRTGKSWGESRSQSTIELAGALFLVGLVTTV